MKLLAEKLRSRGLKITPQRLAIYHMLYNSQDHPGAEYIYKTLETTHPSMSLATVYKTLDTLTRANLIQELNVGEDRYRYDYNTESHPHVICLECREVSDLKTIELIQKLRYELSKQTDFLILSEQLYFYGLCKSCRDMKPL